MKKPKKLHMGDEKEEVKQYQIATAAPRMAQLDMFDEGWISDGRADESRTLDVFDALPKFHFTLKRTVTDLDNLALIRSTTYRETWYQTTLTPAIVIDAKTKKGKAIFPGEREELVERALRKMAVQNILKAQTYKESKERDYIELVFSLYSLRKELAETNHQFTYAQIREALEVLSGCTLTIQTKADKRINGMRSPLLPHLNYSYKEKDETGEESFVSVTSHPLAAEAVKTQACYPINYHRMMCLPSALARWLYTRMSHNFRQADRKYPFKGWRISLETILNESGIVREPRIRDSIKTVRKALAELKTWQVLAPLKAYDETPEHNQDKEGKGRKPITNVLWVLYPSGPLTNEITEGNHKMKIKRAKLK